MSYDLMVFEPDAPPKEPRAFLEWYRKLTEWGEGHNYDDPGNTTKSLRAWYNDMRPTFPAMNGPDGSDNFDSDRITGYTCANAAIYADFRWSVAEQANKTAFELAKKHRLGFWDVSYSTDVWGPTAESGYDVWFKINPND